ncbi:MAG: tetratricopeptide repeat protein [Proteobacteria bacterium]|nr:tetratricopeptide repeat protein [Pseudomonadota bacterium]
MNTKAVLIGAGLLVALAAIFFLRSPAPDPPTPDAVANPDQLPDAPEPTVSAEDDPWIGSLQLLRDEASGVSPRNEDGSRGQDRDSFVAHARELADEALVDKRPDVSAQVGRILVEADEVDFAGAVLQRAVGLMKADEFGEDHYYALAEIRRSQGRPVEAASLLERVVHAPPTLAAEFVGLSDHYLASGRPGPAKAAVSRGLREHAADPMLRTQGAKVAMLQGDLVGAIASADALLAEDPNNLAARLVKVEAQIGAGQIVEASAAAAALREDLPAEAWGYIYGAAVARVGGDPAKEWIAAATELAGDCPCTHDQRLTIAWASQVRQGAASAPRDRGEVSASAAPAP